MDMNTLIQIKKDGTEEVVTSFLFAALKLLLKDMGI